MAFPGGRREKDETGFQTCVREVEEEIGLDLGNAKRWRLLGRLDDESVPTYKKTEWLLLSTFGSAPSYRPNLTIPCAPRLSAHLPPVPQAAFLATTPPQ